MGIEVYVDEARELESQDEVERILGRVERDAARLHGFEMMAGGLLEREDELTAYSHLSAQVRGQLVIAVDHLQSLSRHFQKFGLPMSAHYTLMRTAIECTATALWLLGPNKSATRVIRALRTIWWASEDAAPLAEFMNYKGGKSGRRLLTRLEELRDMRPGNGDRQIDIRRIRTTDMLIDVDRILRRPKDQVPLLTVWRACSGMAHGNQKVANMLLERRQPQGYKHDEYYVTSSWTVTASLLGVVVTAFGDALDLLEERSRTPR